MPSYTYLCHLQAVVEPDKKERERKKKVKKTSNRNINLLTRIISSSLVQPTKFYIYTNTQTTFLLTNNLNMIYIQNIM